MNEEVYITFENYLNSELSVDEKLAFDNRLEADLDFKKSFDLYKETTAFLGNKFDSETTEFKANLKTISKQNFKVSDKKESINQPKVIQFKPYYFAIAASLILFSGIWFMMNQDADYSEYYQHENANFVERGSVIKNLKLAQDAFNAKNYKVAIENFEIVLKENNQPEIDCFYGISLIEDNRFADAETVFLRLENGTSIYKEKAIWNLALLNLKQKKIEETKSYLKQLSEDSEDFDKAQKLLKELE